MVYANWMCFDSQKTGTQRTNSQISALRSPSEAPPTPLQRLSNAPQRLSNALSEPLKAETAPSGSTSDVCA